MQRARRDLEVTAAPQRSTPKREGQKAVRSLTQNVPASTSTTPTTYGRPVHGRAMQHNRTPEQRARYTAESIALRIDEGRAWSWSEYGLEANDTQQALVRAALAALR